MTHDRAPWIWTLTVAAPLAGLVLAPFGTAAVAWLSYSVFGFGVGWSKAIAMATAVAMTAGPFGFMIWRSARVDQEIGRLAADIAAIEVNDAGDESR